MERMTRQRQAVLEEMERVPDFRSAQQIFEDLQARGQRIGLATVYRTLQTLAESHAVDVLRSANGEGLFRRCADRGHHHHLVCRVCGHTEEISLSSVESWVARVALEHGFTEVEHSMELFGVCGACTALLAAHDGPGDGGAAVDALAPGGTAPGGTAPGGTRPA